MSSWQTCSLPLIITVIHRCCFLDHLTLFSLLNEFQTGLPRCAVPRGICSVWVCVTTCGRVDSRKCLKRESCSLIQCQLLVLTVESVYCIDTADIRHMSTLCLRFDSFFFTISELSSLCQNGRFLSKNKRNVFIVVAYYQNRSTVYK